MKPLVKIAMALGLLLLTLPVQAQPAGRTRTTPERPPVPRATPFAPRKAEPVAQALPGTAAELARELRRAEMAWRSGASLLEAKARLDRVLTRAPENADARRLRARVHLDMGRPADALADAEVAARLRPSDAESQLLVCESARLTRQRARALVALDAASRLVIRDATLHVRLAYNAAELGDLERAEAFARIAVQQDADLSAAHLQLARVFALQQQDEAAIAALVRGATRGALDRRAVLADDLLRRYADAPDLRRVLR